ncbi:hypothetical protein [Granulicella aggregans]|uniref:hypothetical protein n=1 Tax=Granulicella aggregans TaxID=474949 RepID=UPI0021DF9D36|nr:hypothetical protein [Granulicella aggregans]
MLTPHNSVSFFALAFVPWYEMFYVNYRLVNLVSAIVLLVIAMLLPRLIPKRFDSSRIRLATRLTRWMLVIQAVAIFSQGLLPLGFISGIIETLVGLVLASVFLPNLFNPLEVKPIEDEEIQAGVLAIFNSEKFLTSLSTVLPKGDEDEKFGLDYIPFLLQAIDQRRHRVEVEARYFLGATVVAALFFSSAVVYFGYILVNESSAGSAKILADIRQDTSQLTQDLFLLDMRVSNPRFEKNILPIIKQLEATDAGPDNSDIKKVLDNDLTTAVANDAPLQSVMDALETASRAIKSGGKQEISYRDHLIDVQRSLSSLIENQVGTQNQLKAILSDMKPLIDSAQKSIQEPTNRTAELIKRLGLGIVVSTFFLALLRYLGSLYKARYEQVLVAQTDEFMVRKFYVAFKSSLVNDEQRKAVLTTFMSGTASPVAATAATSEGDDSSKQSLDLLKELMSALSKKL